MRTLAILLSVALLSGACSSRDTAPGDSASEPAQNATTPPASTGGTPAAEAAALPPDPPTATGLETPPASTPPVAGEVTLTGNVGCGSCSFGIGEKCTAAFQTTDGVVYLLEGVSAGSPLFVKRETSEPVQITGVAREEEGLRYFTVSSFEL